MMRAVGRPDPHDQSMKIRDKLSKLFSLAVLMTVLGLLKLLPKRSRAHRRVLLPDRGAGIHPPGDAAAAP